MVFHKFLPTLFIFTGLALAQQPQSYQVTYSIIENGKNLGSYPITSDGNYILTGVDNEFMVYNIKTKEARYYLKQNNSLKYIKVPMEDYVFPPHPESLGCQIQGETEILKRKVEAWACTPSPAGIIPMIWWDKTLGLDLAEGYFDGKQTIIEKAAINIQLSSPGNLGFPQGQEISLDQFRQIYQSLP